MKWWSALTQQTSLVSSFSRCLDLFAVDQWSSQNLVEIEDLQLEEMKANLLPYTKLHVKFPNYWDLINLPLWLKHLMPHLRSIPRHEASIRHVGTSSQICKLLDGLKLRQHTKLLWTSKEPSWPNTSEYYYSAGFWMRWLKWRIHSFNFMCHIYHSYMSTPGPFNRWLWLFHVSPYIYIMFHVWHLMQSSSSRTHL